MLACAMVRPARRAWIEGLAAAATLFALVPLVDALMVSRNLFTGLAAGDWLFVGFDAVMVLLAASFACAARIASRVTLPTSSRLRRARGPQATASYISWAFCSPLSVLASSAPVWQSIRAVLLAATFPPH